MSTRVAILEEISDVHHGLGTEGSCGASTASKYQRNREAVCEADSHQQRTIHFSGRVQGVGFRYTTERIARGFDVAGFVQNLPDGRVLLHVEGRAAEVERFVSAIASSLDRHIADVRTAIKPAGDNFDGFSIRH